MRGLPRGCLAVVALLFATSSASAFAVSMTARGATTGLMTSDTVTVDVFLDVAGPISIFSVAVINSNTSALLYDGYGLLLAPGTGELVADLALGRPPQVPADALAPAARAQASSSTST